MWEAQRYHRESVALSSTGRPDCFIHEDSSMSVGHEETFTRLKIALKTKTKLFYTSFSSIFCVKINLSIDYLKILSFIHMAFGGLAEELKCIACLQLPHLLLISWMIHLTAQCLAFLMV